MTLETLLVAARSVSSLAKRRTPLLLQLPEPVEMHGSDLVSWNDFMGTTLWERLYGEELSSWGGAILLRDLFS
jgi:hypothetical protein